MMSLEGLHVVGKIVNNSPTSRSFQLPFPTILGVEPFEVC